MSASGSPDRQLDRVVGPRGVSAWRATVFAVFAANGIANATWISRIPAVRDTLDLSAAGVGGLVLSVAIGAIVGLALGGALVHRVGDRLVIRGALALSGFGLVVAGIGAFLVVSPGLAAVGFAIFGVATGMTDLAMNISGAGVERATGSPIMPWFHASWSIGTVAGALLGAGAAALHVLPIVQFTAIALAVTIAAVLVGRWLPVDASAPEGDEPVRLGWAERMRVWREPRTLLIGLVMLGMAFTEGSANDWIALAFVDGHGASAAGGALAFGVFAAAMTIGRIGGVPLLARFGRVRVLRVAAVTAAVGLAIVILVPIPEVAFAGAALWGLGASLGFPVGISAAADDPATATARVSAVTIVGYTAFLLGPPIIGFAADAIGILGALWIVLALIVVATLAIPGVRPPAT